MDSPEGYLRRTAINIFNKKVSAARLLGRVVVSAPTSSGAPDAAVMLSEAFSPERSSSRQRAALVLTKLFGYRRARGREDARREGVDYRSAQVPGTCCAERRVEQDR